MGGVRSSQQGGWSGPANEGGSGPADGGSGPADGEGGSGPAGGGGVRSSRGGGGQHLAPSRGRYASCVHAGGLSCLWSFYLKRIIIKILVEPSIG